MRQVPIVRGKIDYFKSEGYRIIYVDEMMTTKSTIPTTEWSCKNKPLKLDYKQFTNQGIATVAGISMENGVDLVMTFKESVNTDKFDQYITALRRKYNRDKIAIFMDQLMVHRTIRIRRRFEELGLGYILNAPYSPNFNPIEGVFSQVKQRIKTQRL